MIPKASCIILMKFNLFLLIIFSISNINAESIGEYSAKYSYISDEISIKGIRKLEIIDNQYLMNFKAKNLLASMEISSSFKINNKILKTNSYKIKVRPSFVNRDQRIKFDYDNKTISSSGKAWLSSTPIISISSVLSNYSGSGAPPSEASESSLSKSLLSF